jgi:hypothetical protein
MPKSELPKPPHEKSSIRFYTTAAALVLLAYAISFGPAMWLIDRKLLPAWTKQTVSYVYYPIFWLSMVGPRPVRESVQWYAELGARPRPENLIDDPKIPSGLRRY